MDRKRTVAAVLCVIIVLLSYPVCAAGSPAYNALAEEEPVYQRELTLSELEEYYDKATTDELLDPAECNYMYGEVSVGGIAEFCHVYMRTFVITDVSELSVYDLEALAKRIVGYVKKSASDKYLKCITKTYNARISGIVQREDGKIDSVTVKIFISCGEKTEDRKALREGYIARIAEQLRPLGDGERFLALNSLMLDGRFRYDMSYLHRCSAVALVTDGMGVCEEYAGFTSLVLDALGYENRIITGDVGGVPHMWNIVKVDGRYYHLDILHDGPVDENGVHTSANRTYLLVSEETVASTHTIAEQYISYSSQAMYDYVFDGYPESIPNTVERDGVRFLPVGPLTTVSMLSEQLSSGGFIVFKRDGSELLPDDVAGTGCTAELCVNGKVLDSCEICVAGDADGDGAITGGDTGAVTAALLSVDPGYLGGIYKTAADYDGNGELTVTDLIMIYDIIRIPHNENEESGGEVTVP